MASYGGGGHQLPAEAQLTSRPQTRAGIAPPLTRWFIKTSKNSKKTDINLGGFLPAQAPLARFQLKNEQPYFLLILFIKD